MVNVDLVFIVLVYRNETDLMSLMTNLQNRINQSYKVVVVNSYYDEESETKIKNIAQLYNGDFISVPNKGYGAGNNAGVAYAKSKYHFEFLVVCNPDTEIIHFDYNDLMNKQNYVVAPEIVTLNHKKQNPFRLIGLKSLDKIKYTAFKDKKYFLLYIDIIINKIAKVINRQVNKIASRRVIPIYSCHGSFFIIGNAALEQLGELFNEEMFLFAEEDHLAKLCEYKMVSILMLPNIQVLHKEDGSMQYVKENNMALTGTSYKVYYEYWYHRRKSN